MLIGIIINKIKVCRIAYSNAELAKLLVFKLKIWTHRFWLRLFWPQIFTVAKQPFRAFQPKLDFFFTDADASGWAEHLKNFGDSELIIAAADQSVNHVYNLLGSGPVALGARINWGRDFKSGFTWPARFYQDLQPINPSNNADVKVAWELSRFQHLPGLGQAYWLTHDERYAACFQADLEDWIAANPVGYGINWVCAMEAAIRAVNWIIGSYYFLGATVIAEEFWASFKRQLYLTGKFISRNLEAQFTGHGNNHYLANLAGLLWLALYFGDYDCETRRWRKLTAAKLEREILWQFNPEGTNFEAALPYHRLATEIALSTLILAERNQVVFSDQCRGRIEKACAFTAAYTKPNGLTPQIGDADDGRFHIFTNYGYEEKRDHRHLLAVGGVYFKRPEWVRLAGDRRDEAFWFFGAAALTGWKPTEPEQSLGEPQCLAYPRLGCYLIRDQRIYLLIRCGRLAKSLKGAHAHNDQLSFELNVEGRDLVIDPGSYLYTADARARNIFRGVGMHNTVQVGDEEPNCLDDTQLFQLRDRAQAQTLTWRQEDGQVLFCGEQRGFYESCGVIHQRKIAYFTPNRIVIWDDLNPAQVGTARFILAPGTEVRWLKPDYLQIAGRYFMSFSSGPIRINQVPVSESYGVKKNADQIEVRFRQSLMTEIRLGDGNS